MRKWLRDPTPARPPRRRRRTAATLAAAAITAALAAPGAGPEPAPFLGTLLPAGSPAAADTAAVALLDGGYRAALQPFLMPLEALRSASGSGALRPGSPDPYVELLGRLAGPLRALRRVADAVMASSRPGDGPATLDSVTHDVGARVFWAAGITGAGVDVALVDTGVAPIAGLAGEGHLVQGPDLSPSLGGGAAPQDGFGHGTHLAAAIAGRDDGPVAAFGDPGLLRGVAPDARLVDVKVGASDGSVEVDRVVAALDWIVEHGRSGNLDIRVVTLAFGIPAPGGAAGERLAAAVERAWRAGVVVVVAAGNDGNGIPARSPGGGPFAITVGSADSDGSYLTPDPVSSFTNCSAERPVDLLAPGRSVLALAAPGSEAVALHPDAVVEGRWIAGTGTSQAAAVVAGAAALLLEQRPGLTPDQVEAILVGSAAAALGNPACTGAGVLDLGTALTAPAPEEPVVPVPPSPIGPLGPDRGASWSSTSWSGSSWSGTSWSSTSWSGSSWSGTSWSGSIGDGD